MSLAVLQPCQQLGKYIGSLNARGGRAGTVGVEILMDVEDEVGGAAVWVGDAGQDGC